MLKIIVIGIHGAIYGLIVGLLWWLALGTISALYMSTAVGAGLGAVMGVLSAIASHRTLNEKEGVLVSGMVLALAAVIGGVGALAVWAYRAFAG